MTYKYRGTTNAVATSTVWVAVGDSGHIATSNTLTSGSAWTTYVAPAGASVEKRSVAYGADPNSTNVFFVGHNFDQSNELMSSSAPLNGVDSWSVVDPGGIQGVYGIAYSNYGGTSWIGVGYHGETVRLSSGSWSNTDIGTDNIWSIATDGSGNWVVGTSTSNRRFEYWKSENDGVTWASSFNEGWVANAANYRKHVAYGNGVWVASNRDRIHSATSANLQSNSWTLRLDATDHINDIQYGTDSKWMAIGHSRDVYISTDNGTNWSQATDIPGSDEPTGLAYHNGSWVVVTDGTVNNIVVSTDHGSSWTAIASTGGSLNEIAVNSVLPNS